MDKKEINGSKIKIDKKKAQQRITTLLLPRFHFPFTPLFSVKTNQLSISIDYSSIPLFQFKIENCLLEFSIV
jgi:hypothetical protein